MGNIFKATIKSLYFDNVGEYIGLKSYLSMYGIGHYTTAIHTLQQNDVFKRRHCYLVEIGLTLFTDTHMPHSYGLYAFQAAT